MGQDAKMVFKFVCLLSLTTLTSASSPCDDMEGTSSCRCTWMPVSGQTIINCSRSNLTEVPDNLPSITNILDLSYNPLSTQKLGSVCKYSALHTLILSTSGITTLPDRTFSMCDSFLFDSIDLSGNVIGSVSNEALYGLDTRRIIGLEALNISSLALRTQRHLKHLSIKFHQQNIPEELFKGLRLEVLNISVTKAITLPSSLLKPLSLYLKELRIKGDYFQNIDVNRLEGFNKLQIFELHVEISSLFHMSLFESTPELRKIILSGVKEVVPQNSKLSILTRLQELTINGAHKLSHNIFNNLPSLRTLDVSQSHVDSLSGQWFSGDTVIQHLNMSQIGLAYLGQQTLVHVGKLETLDVSHNILSILEHGVFLPISDSVISIHLEGNLLQQLHEQIFINCTRLEYIDLSNNKIVSIGSDVFDTLSSLHTLNLRDNKLSGLDAGIFLSTSNLQHLDLSSNTLAEIPVWELQKLSSLTNLDLSNNRIVAVPGSISDSVPSLTRLDLRFNPLNCHCESVLTWTKYQILQVLATCKLELRDLDILEFLKEAKCVDFGSYATLINTTTLRNAKLVDATVQKSVDISVQISATKSVRVSDTIHLTPGSTFKWTSSLHTTLYHQSSISVSNVTLYPSGKSYVTSDGKQTGSVSVHRPTPAVIHHPSVIAGDVMEDEVRNATGNVTKLMTSLNSSDPASKISSRSTTDDTGNGFYTAVIFITAVTVACIVIVAFLVWRKRGRGERYDVSNLDIPDGDYTSLSRDKSPVSPKGSLAVLKEVPSIQIETVDDDDNVHVVQYSTPDVDVSHRPELDHGK